MKTVKKPVSIILAVLLLLSLIPGFSVSALGYNDFGYNLLSDGTAELVNVPGKSEVIIPKELNGHTVSSIALSDESVIEEEYEYDEEGYNYFWDYKRIFSITVPEGVKKISSNSFEYLNNLSSVNVDENSPYFSSIDGVVYNKDKTKLVYYPQGKEDKSFTVPDGVKEIGDNAFAKCGYLESVVMPEGVEKIGANAFCNDADIASITMPDTVTEIGYGAFIGCYNLKQIKLSENLTKISGMLFESSGLTSVDIPKSVTSIGERAFAFTSVEVIDLPPSVEKIGKEAFMDSGITSINISAGVKSIGEDAFRRTDRLYTVKVDSGNTAYCSDENVLYNKDKTELILCANGTHSTFIVPMSVQKIAYGAFLNRTHITSVYVSANVTSMTYCGFSVREYYRQGDVTEDYHDVTLYGFENSAAQRYSERFVHFSPITQMPGETTAPVETTAASEETSAPAENPTEPQETSAPAEKSTEPQETTAPTDNAAEPQETTNPVETPDVTESSSAEPSSVTPDTTSAKKDNPVSVTVKTKTVKLKKLKKKAQKVKAITVNNAQGKVTYKLVKKGSTAKIFKLAKINSKGVITINKWKKAEKGVYKFKVKITAKGNEKYKPKKVTKTVKIRVK